MTVVKPKEIKHNSNKGALSPHVISVDPPWGCQDKQGEIWLVNTWEGVLAGKFQGVDGGKWFFEETHNKEVTFVPFSPHGKSLTQCLR